MGCACEDGARDSFYAVIISVTDRNFVVAGLNKLKGKIPEKLLQELRKRFEEMPHASFSVLLKCQDGSEMSVGCGVFPQTQEWAKERIGKPLHVVMTQLANRHGGGLSMDVHES